MHDSSEMDSDPCLAMFTNYKDEFDGNLSNGIQLPPLIIKNENSEATDDKIRLEATVKDTTVLANLTLNRSSSFSLPTPAESSDYDFHTLENAYQFSVNTDPIFDTNYQYNILDLDNYNYGLLNTNEYNIGVNQEALTASDLPQSAINPNVVSSVAKTLGISVTIEKPEVDKTKTVKKQRAKAVRTTKPSKPICYPFLCDECHSKFRTAASLGRHKDYVHFRIEVKCVIESCPHISYSHIDLNKHAKSHSKDEDMRIESLALAKANGIDIVSKQLKAEISTKDVISRYEKRKESLKKLKKFRAENPDIPIPKHKKVSDEEMYQKLFETQKYYEAKRDKKKDVEGMKKILQKKNDYFRVNYSCIACKKIYTTAYDAKRHYEFHKRKETVCNICNISVRGEMSLRSHILKYHPKTYEITEPKFAFTFICSSEKCPRIHQQQRRNVYVGALHSEECREQFDEWKVSQIHPYLSESLDNSHDKNEYYFIQSLETDKELDNETYGEIEENPTMQRDEVTCTSQVYHDMKMLVATVPDTPEHVLTRNDFSTDSQKNGQIQYQKLPPIALFQKETGQHKMDDLTNQTSSYANRTYSSESTFWQPDVYMTGSYQSSSFDDISNGMINGWNGLEQNSSLMTYSGTHSQQENIFENNYQLAGNNSKNGTQYDNNRGMIEDEWTTTEFDGL